MKYKKLEKLEAISGFCALYVMLLHLLPQKIFLLGINVGILFRFGSEAVVMFFILSGFVIKYSWEKSTDKSFKNYFLKRFMRFYIPLFFIFLLAYLIKSYTEGSIADTNWKTLLGNVFMLQDVISNYYLVIEATYLDFINNKISEYGVYIIFMVLFSYLLKVVVFNKIKNLLVSKNLKTSTC
jgi:peptidoglycan/LPS O-acetylase OafA/YrhL